MQSKIDTELFLRIMDLPESARVDLLGFAASAAVGKEQLQQILDDLAEALPSANPIAV